MGRRAPGLPHAAIGQLPEFRNPVGHPLDRGPAVPDERRVEPLEEQGRVEDLPVDVELELLGRGVPDPHRARPLVAVEVGKLDLFRRRPPVHGIDRAQILAVLEPRGTIERPADVGAGLR